MPYDDGEPIECPSCRRGEPCAENERIENAKLKAQSWEAMEARIAELEESCDALESRNADLEAENAALKALLDSASSGR